MIALNDIAEQAYMIAKARDLDTDIVSTLKHCAGEVVEATEAYTKFVSTESPNKAAEYKKDLALEIADIIICALTASARIGEDIEDCISQAMQKNAQRAYAERK